MMEALLAAPWLPRKIFHAKKCPKNGYIRTLKGIVRELDQKMMFFDDFPSCPKSLKQCRGHVKIFWGSEQIGNLIRGSSIISPIAEALNTEYISSEKKLLISAKLQKWLENEIDDTLHPLNRNLNEV